MSGNKTAQILLKLGAAHSHSALVRDKLNEMISNNHYTLNKQEVVHLLQSVDECLLSVARAADLLAEA